jgi:hypothetical protein
VAGAQHRHVVYSAQICVHALFTSDFLPSYIIAENGRVGNIFISRSLSKNPRVDKGPQPLMFNPALTHRFSYFADFAARERMREAKPVKLKKVAFSHFFDTLWEIFLFPDVYSIIYV